MGDSGWRYRQASTDRCVSCGVYVTSAIERCVLIVDSMILICAGLGARGAGFVLQVNRSTTADGGLANTILPMV